MQLAFKAISLLEDKDHISLNVSEVWLQKFQHHWNLKAFSSDKDNGDISAYLVDSAIPALNSKFCQFTRGDIFVYMGRAKYGSGWPYQLARDKTISYCATPEEDENIYIFF